MSQSRIGGNEFGGSKRYEIRRRIGAGGMGVVYEAHDRERGGLVALKTLRNLEPKALYRLKAEFRALADLAHPNLVRLGELHGEGDAWFFTMELLDGQDFLTYVRGGAWTPEATTTTDAGTSPIIDRTAVDPRTFAIGPDEPEPPPPAPPVDERRLRHALRGLASGIAALHAAGKVHRDVKPSNVVVTSADRVVLLDFGLVTDAQRGDMLDSGAHIVGTAAYMAPEQAASGQVGPEADWYAFGCMLYEALTGQAPFHGGQLDVLMKKQRFEPPPPRSLAPEAPRDLDALCAELLHREPRDRPGGVQILERLGAPAALPVAPLASAPSLSEAAPFVGRERELETLRLGFAESCDGLPISTFVLGESGMGKSALVRHFLDGLGDATPGEGAAQPLVLAGRCYEREAVPFKAFDDVVDAIAGYLARLNQVDAALLMPPDAGTLARVFPVLRRVPAMARVSESRLPNLQELRTRAFAAMRDLLRRLARRRRVVLFIDDFQWADADSLALFTVVMHGLEAPPLYFVATVRVSPEEAAAGQLPESLAQVATVPGDLRILPVGALPVDDARELASRLLGRGGGTGAVAEIAREAGGHPLFIHELVRHLGGSGPGARGNVRLDDALWSRIGLLEPAARRLLELLAAAGEPISQRLAGQAAGIDPAELARLTGVLRVASLVRTSGARGSDSIECFHDRVREAVAARLPEPTRRSLHEALANALEAAGTAASQDTQALVRHLEAAGLAERAAEHAARAGRAAAHALAFDRAAALFATALRLGKHDDATVLKLRIEQADALVYAGRCMEAADVYLAAAEGADAPMRLECRRKAAQHLIGSGDIERGLATLDGVLAEFGESLPATPKRALASLLWHRLKLRVRGIGWRPRDPAEISPRDLAMIDIYHSVGVGLGMVDNIRGADYQARGLLLALKTGERLRVARAIGLEAAYVSSQGPRANARGVRLALRCKEIVGDDPDPYLNSWAWAGLGITSYLGGRFDAGEAELSRAESGFRDGTVGTAWELSTIRLFRMLALRFAGRWGEMRRTLDDYVRDAARRGDRYAETTMTRAFNLVWLVADDPARARRELAFRSWSPPEGGYHMQHWYELRARTDLALYERDVPEATRLLASAFEDLGRSFLLRVQTLRSEATWLRGRVALAQAAAGRAEALEDARRVVKQLGKERVGYAQAWTALVAAGLAGQEGNAAGARAQLERARELSSANRLRMCEATAALLLGDATGADVMHGEGVQNPAAIVEMLVPGLAKTSAPRD